ncbi:phosphomannomutase CpsG [Buttiauxella izardii]|uniref:Phosphomannomutase n=1 Tax=Buttiauxella izardii TaxID=82991 RepID=A0A3A5JN96_9ENTR|nr:phosphomannomutase CpsG [Buttiauxella izardii]RJT20943.1 phosphomannomutase CpsG [Buttiauxella izardii]
MDELQCFKTYDIRGEVDITINHDIVLRIAQAVATWLKPKRIVIGCDSRLTSEEYKQTLAKGLIRSGVDVIDIGMVGTEEVYFATRLLNADGGIQITASHNPANYNGMKIVREQARPVSNDNGLLEIKALALANDFTPAAQPGNYQRCDHRDAWVEHLMSYITTPLKRPLRVVVNAGNGAAGPAFDAIEKALHKQHAAVEFIKLHFDPDGHFPAGVPNPMLEENRFDTRAAVVLYKADLGIAWDGDFDRCFFFDSHGDFIESYYLVGLLAAWFLEQNPGETIIHDPRLMWNTRQIISQCWGVAVESKTGHAFIKDAMRRENAIYGGEMSGHHYFRSFGYCDSGMIPALLMIQLLNTNQKKLSELIAERIKSFPISGEINITVKNPLAVMKHIETELLPLCLSQSDCDGLSMEFTHWRFNLRSSNTEPLLRLNVESRNDKALMQEKTSMLLSLIESL